MEPLITNRLDPALLRVIDKRTNERELPQRRRRPPVTEEEEPEKAGDKSEEKHQLDDLA